MLPCVLPDFPPSPSIDWSPFPYPTVSSVDPLLSSFCCVDSEILQSHRMWECPSLPSSEAFSQLAPGFRLPLDFLLCFSPWSLRGDFDHGIFVGDSLVPFLLKVRHVWKRFPTGAIAAFSVSLPLRLPPSLFVPPLFFPRGPSRVLARQFTWVLPGDSAANSRGPGDPSFPPCLWHCWGCAGWCWLAAVAHRPVSRFFFPSPAPPYATVSRP